MSASKVNPLKRSRAQAHTLEGVIAALIILSGLVFSLQVSAVTPLSASTSSQYIENQQGAAASGVLATAAERGVLKEAVLFWNESEGAFHNVSSFGYYTAGGPPNAFGRMLNQTFDPRGVAFNVYLVYVGRDGQLNRIRLVYRGAPSDNAVTATRLVTVFDDDPLYDHEGVPTAVNVSASDTLYMPDAQPNDPVFNLVRVEVVAWRM